MPAPPLSFHPADLVIAHLLEFAESLMAHRKPGSFLCSYLHDHILCIGGASGARRQRLTVMSAVRLKIYEGADRENVVPLVAQHPRRVGASAAALPQMNLVLHMISASLNG